MATEHDKDNRNYGAFAYGWVAAGANPFHCTPNIKGIKYNTALHCYEIDTEQPYEMDKYITIITPEAQCFGVRGFNNGKLTISLFLPNGDPCQADFQFVNYKL